MHHQIPFFSTLRYLRKGFKCLLKNGLEELSFVNTLATFGIGYATNPLLQNMTKIVGLR